MNEQDIARFKTKLKYLDDGCIEFQGAKTGTYGYFSVRGKNYPAHRFAYLWLFNLTMIWKRWSNL